MVLHIFSIFFLFYYTFFRYFSTIVYRDDYYKTADAAPNHLTELIIAKHRNGPTGKVDLFFKNDCTKFVSLNERNAG